MSKYKEKSSINSGKAFILSLLSRRPKSTNEILKEVNEFELHPFIQAFISLLKEGKIEMIGFYPCQISGQEMPYYLGYTNSAATLRKSNSKR